MKNIINFCLLFAIACLASSISPLALATDQPPVSQEKPKEDEHFVGNYLSGQFAREHGNINQAIHYLSQVQQGDPQNVQVASQLQGMLLVQGKIDEAMKLAASGGEKQKKDSLSILLLALQDVKDNKLDKASKLLDKAASEGPVQLWQPLIAAWVDLGRHTITKPLTIEQFSADVGRAAPLVYYHLALINEKAGFVDAAAQDFKSAVEDIKNPPSLVIRPLLHFYAQHNKPDILKPIVKAYLETHPDATNMSTTMIANTQDGVAEVLYTMGGIMLGADITNDAVIYLQLALYVKPDFADAALGLGDAYVQLQQYENANTNYARITKDNPSYVKSQLQIAINEDRMGKFDAALSRLDKTAVLSPAAQAASLITRGDLLRTRSRFAEAVDAYTEAMQRVPELNATYWPVLFARASCYERMGKWNDAEKDLLQALKLNPSEPDILNYLGYGWLEHGQHLEEARKMIAQAFKERPDNAEIVDSMGWSMYLQGDYDAAAGYIEKAVELLPGDPTVNDHLGDVYWRLGRKTEARYQWERSLSFSPELPLANALHQKIKEGLPASGLPNTVSELSGDKPSGKPTPE